jgi:hypothetical protein
MEDCKLYGVLGETRACPREECGLWEDGDDVRPGGCAVARLGFDLTGRPDVGEWLLALRGELERARGD